MSSPEDHDSDRRYALATSYMSWPGISTTGNDPAVSSPRSHANNQHMADALDNDLRPLLQIQIRNYVCESSLGYLV